MNRMILFALLLIVSFSTGCKEQPQEAPQGPPQAPPVTVITPIVTNVVDWKRFSGRLDASQTVDVRARVSGHLESIHFEDGDFVQQGQLLFVVDPKPAEIALSRAQSQVDQAKASLKRANATLQQALARKKQAESQHALALTRYENGKKALATNSIAREQVDTRASELEQAAALLLAETASVESATAEIATSEVAIRAADVEVADAKNNLSYTRIHARISGRIGRKLVTPGNLIRGGGQEATLLTTIVAVDPIYAYVEASEHDVMEFMKGVSFNSNGEEQTTRPAVYMTLLGETGYQHVGQLDFIDNRLQNGTGSLSMRAIFKNETLALMPGMFGRLRIATTEKSNAVLVPDAVVGSDQSDRFVLVVGENNIVERRSVMLGAKLDGLRVIESGLEGTESLIQGGMLGVFPGMPVAPSPAKEQPKLVEDGLPNSLTLIPRSAWTVAPINGLKKDGGQKK